MSTNKIQNISQDIIDKYNVPVPRYTSYPPANYFEDFTEVDYLNAVDKSNTASDNHLSFYFHIPFCRHLCHYCACNSYSMQKPEIVASYVDALHKEIDLLLPHLNSNRKISQIHYGGGTPTTLDPMVIKELNDHLLSHFNTIDRPEIAIECHPGYLTLEKWEQLANCGFTRMSIGIQDFNEAVLKTVNRRPTCEPIEDVVALLRQSGIRFNMDFLYGLPGQTPESFAETIRQAIELHPDRLVTFSYAHVPWLKKQQLILEKAGLPTTSVKENIFATASQLLHEAGYKSVGLDHFVLPDDELYIAQQNHQLHRNFQGYCTRRTTAQVYAFGVTGISQLDAAYAQNTKNIAEYIEQTNHGQLTIRKGHALSDEERLTREVIETLMCNYRINWQEIANHTQTSVEQLKAATAYNEQKLQEFAADGIIRFDESHLEMTDDASPMVRNVAASLDPLMLKSDKSFSKAI
uniref:Coproporphyrinogen-III oxidase n=1 Tax=Prevotella sp. GTC17262 TaxID=3236797 RepID=A0AB33JU94_9BACT